MKKWRKVAFLLGVIAAALYWAASKNWWRQPEEAAQHLVITPEMTREAGGETVTPAPGRIAFVSQRDGHPQVYACDADGANQVNLSNTPAADGAPCWSLDGRLLAFVRTDDDSSDVWVMAPDGSGQRALTRSGQYVMELSWSPDGKSIAFARHGSDGRWGICIVDLAGGEPVSLTPSDAEDFAPRFSPDGSRIAFTAGVDGSGGVWVMEGRATRPLWSPDGAWIAFASERDGVPGVHAVNVSTGEERELRGCGQFPQPEAWSPDGTRLACTGTVDDLLHVFLVGLDGKDAVRLTEDGASDWGAAWSPDGSHIAFVSDRDGNDEIYVMSATGGKAHRLTSNDVHDGEPAWRRG